MAKLPNFADDFPPPGLATWQALVDKGLKGAPFEQRLVAWTEDGLRIPPLFTSADELPEPGLPGAAPWVRGPLAGRTGWDIRALCRLSDPIAANRAILAELNGGASSILLEAGGVSLADLLVMLDGVMPDLAPVHLSCRLEDLPRLDGLPEGVLLRLDPLEAWASGRAADPGSALDATLDALLVRGGGLSPSWRLAVGGGLFDDAGASDAEEIGLTIALVIACARRLEERGGDPKPALERMILGVTTNADYFAGIAKLRALRRLWARVTQVLGVDLPPTVHAVTSARMLARYDIPTNLLRNTIACAAAGIGGAGAVTVLPHDHARGLPDAFAARMARNIQNILQEESGLGLVTDPLGGSWYMEQRTEQLAQAAWTIVQQVEAAGGLAAADAGQMVEAMLARRRQARCREVATRTRPILGISQFPDAGEAAVPPRGPCLQRRLPRVRDAEPFEELRDRVLAKELPPVFLVTLGPVARHTARLGFASNLLAAAGLRSIAADPADLPGKEARLALIAGADEDLDREVVAIASRLRAAGTAQVHVLGRPGVREEEWRAAGVTRFVAQGQDMVRYLNDVVELLS